MERLGGGVDIGLVKRAHRVHTDLSDESHLQNKDLGNLLIWLSAFNIQNNDLLQSACCFLFMCSFFN